MTCRLMALAMLFAMPVLSGTNSVIVVSAPRLDDLDLMAVDTAADVTVIDRESIERSGAASVPELLQKEANVLVRSASGNGDDGQISMRGFGENSHLRTLVVVDGHKLNRPDMAGIEWSSLPVANIERIEVIRGGQNVLYGNHALSGVIKITSKRGADAGRQVAGSFGSYGYRAGSIGYGGWAGDVDYTVGAGSYWNNGFRSNAVSRATSLFGSASWYINDADSLTLRVSHSDSYAQHPGSLSYEQMQQDPTRSTASGDDHVDTQSSLASLIWETERSWGAARMAAGLNLRDLDWQQSGTFSHNRMLGVSFGPRARLGGDASFVIGGVDLNYDAVDFTGYDPRDTDYIGAYAELDRLTVAPYGFAQRSLGKGITLNGGVRFEQARTDNRYVDYVDDQILPTDELLGIGTIPNPNYKTPPDADPAASYAGVIAKEGWAAELSLAFELSEASSLWVGYDRAYRYPTLDESAAYQGFPLSDPLNENLDPETGDQFEVGASCRSESWSVSVSGFYLMMDDEIGYVELPADPGSGTPAVNLNMNIGSTRRLGTELELAVDRTWYGASSRWTLVDARLHRGEHAGNRIPLVPRAYGVSSVWVEPDRLLRLTLSHSYVSGQYEGGDEPNRNRQMDAYGLIGLRADFMLNDQAGLKLSVNNLLDEIYAASAYSGGYYPGSGRTYRVELTWNF